MRSQVAFEEDFTSDVKQALLTVSAMLDIFFMFDLLINFRTGFYVEGVLVRDKKLIALRYVKGWLIVDLLAVPPFALINVMNGSTEGQQTFLLMMRALRDSPATGRTADRWRAASCTPPSHRCAAHLQADQGAEERRQDAGGGG